jgi:glycosyltransferase involved in cell wall biosynthesis
MSYATPRLLLASTVSITLQTFLLPYVAHFRSQGWRVDGVARGLANAPRCQAAFDRCYEIEWTRKLSQVSHLRASQQSLRRLVVENGYDIVHVHTPIAAFVTRYTLRNMRRADGVKVIYTAHGFHFYRGGKPAKNTAFRLLEQLAGRWTDFLVVINREDEQAAQRYQIVPDDRIVYMPGIGVDIQQLDPARIAGASVNAVRSELGLHQNDLLFLMIAEFNAGKRHQDLLHAVAQLRQPNVHVAFAGVGPRLPAMQEMAAALGIGGQTHFLGFRSDIPVLIRASAATVLPSEREGLPRSVMESLALETPVIGTDIRGMRDLLGEGAGLLTAVGDVEQLRTALSTIVEQPAVRTAMGRRGRVQMQNYDTRHIIAAHEALYRRALGRQPLPTT